jgi:molecular chaperone IbpA
MDLLRRKTGVNDALTSSAFVAMRLAAERLFCLADFHSPLNLSLRLLNRRPPGALRGPVRAPASCPEPDLYPCCSTEDVAMRTYDFAPLWRNSIGFDRLFEALNNMQALDGPDSNYPPYDILRTGEDKYRIQLALAGFAPDDVTITAQQNLLTVAGRKTEGTEHQYLYQGISARAFQRQFNLEDHVEVESASFENGLLQINLVRRLPEAMKPRRIEISTAASPRRAKPAVVDTLKAAS